jgi:hypothetical protein
MEVRARAGKNVGKMNFGYAERSCPSSYQQTHNRM